MNQFNPVSNNKQVKTPFQSSKWAFAVLLIFVLANSVKAQTSKQNGAWTSNSTWLSGTAPSTGSLGANVVINHAVTYNSGSLTGNSNNITVTINSGASLTVTGGFAVSGGNKGLTINVLSGGSLIVSGGTTSVTNKGYITIASGATAASFEVLAAKSAGTITINSGATATATSLTTSSNSDAIIDNQGTLTVGTSSVNGSVDSNGVITNSGTMQVYGTFTQENSGNSTTNSGTLNVSSNVFAFGQIQLDPGTSADSNMTITGSLTVDSNPWMIVGNTPGGSCNAAVTHYADLIVKTDVILTGSGDITVNKNGRLLVFGNISKSGGGGGNIVTINCGAQAYVNGNINIGTGGGNTVTNNNTSGAPPTGSNGSPIIGLYVNGTVTDQTTTGTVGTKSQMQSNDLTFYNWVKSVPGSPLPITLESFRIDKINSTSISLNWVTSSEINFDYFEIEKSTDGKNFSKLDQVQGHGTTHDQHSYEFTDYNPIIGKNYYRLKSVDFDKYTETFYVVEADFSSSQNVSIYPNPMTDHTLNIDLNFNADNSMISITDSFGVSKLIVSSAEAQNVLSLTLEPGVYFVTVTSPSFKHVTRLMVK